MRTKREKEKNSMTKKILSFVLAMTLIVSLFAGLTVTASADYEGAGTFVKTTGSLDSGYYVFTYATATTMFPMSNDTSSDKWIKPGPSFTITDTLENPDPSIVWCRRPPLPPSPLQTPAAACITSP